MSELRETYASLLETLSDEELAREEQACVCSWDDSRGRGRVRSAAYHERLELVRAEQKHRKETMDNQADTEFVFEKGPHHGLPVPAEDVFSDYLTLPILDPLMAEFWAKNVTSYDPETETIFAIYRRIEEAKNYHFTSLTVRPVKLRGNADASAGFKDWAILEIMGHRELAGIVSEETLAGAGVIRIDIPKQGDEGFTTQYYAPSALFSMTPCDETLARAFAEHAQPEPVHRWELPAAAEKGSSRSMIDGYDDDDDEDDDDENEPF